MTTTSLLTHVLTAVVGAAVTLLTLRACGGLASDTAQAGRPGEAGHDTIVVERLRVDTVRIEQTTERLRTVERIPDNCLNLEGYSRVRLHEMRGTYNGKPSRMGDPGFYVIKATMSGVESWLVVDLVRGLSVVSNLVSNKAGTISDMSRSNPNAWQKILIGTDTVREAMVKDYPALARLPRPDMLLQMTGEVSYIPYLRLYGAENEEVPLHPTEDSGRGFGQIAGMLRETFLFDHSAVIDVRKHILYFKPGYDLPKGQKPPYPKELY